MISPEVRETLVGKFIGPDVIADVVEIDLTVPSGLSVIEVTLESGKKTIYPPRGLAAVASDEAKDYNYVRDSRVNLMVPEILNVVREYDIPLEQFQWLMTQVVMQYQNNFNRAKAILWFGSAGEYIPGSDTDDRLTLLMADRVNATSAPKEDVSG